MILQLLKKIATRPKELHSRGVLTGLILHRQFLRKINKSINFHYMYMINWRLVNCYSDSRANTAHSSSDKKYYNVRSGAPLFGLWT